MQQTDVEQQPPRTYWTNSAASKGVAWCLWSVPNEDAPGEREDAAESSSPRTRPHANADSDDSVILPPPPTPRSRHVDVGNVSEVAPADPQGDRSSNLQRGTNSEADRDRGAGKVTGNRRAYPASPRTWEESVASGVCRGSEGGSSFSPQLPPSLHKFRLLSSRAPLSRCLLKSKCDLTPHFRYPGGHRP